MKSLTVLSLLALTGCASKGDSAPATSAGTTATTPTGTTTPTTGSTTPEYVYLDLVWTDVDGAPPQDTNGDYNNDLNCTSDTLDIDILDPLGVSTWDFGMAENATYGWTGEDCLNGYASFNLCHPVGTTHQLVQVCTAPEIVEGTSTLLDHGKDPFLTYVIDDGDYCFVKGNDPAYYDTMGCSLLL